MPTSVKEIRAENERQRGLLQELRAAQEAMQARAPGKPAVTIPLDQIFTFKGEDGEPRAVIPIEQVIYLVDEILRDNTAFLGRAQ